MHKGVELDLTSRQARNQAGDGVILYRMSKILGVEKLTHHDTLEAQPFTDGGLVGQSNKRRHLPLPSTPDAFLFPRRSRAGGLRWCLLEGTAWGTAPT